MPTQIPPRTVPIFEVKKKHSWKSDVIKLSEILLITIVLLGTVVWVLLSVRFSFASGVGQLLSFLAPKATTEVSEKNQTAEAQLKQALKDNKFDYLSFVTTKEKDFEVRLATGPVIFFSGKKDYASQVSSLQTLIGKAKIDNKAIKRIDFRFEKIIEEF